MMRLRLAFGFIGMLLAITALARDDKRIAWVAMIVLAVTLVLRLVARRRDKDRLEP
jgi:hypothetical protein